MEYRPERWLEDGVFLPENPFRYLVFHTEPRMCLGKEMAHIQMKFEVLVHYQDEGWVACCVGREGIEQLKPSLPLLTHRRQPSPSSPVKVSKTQHSSLLIIFFIHGETLADIHPRSSSTSLLPPPRTPILSTSPHPRSSCCRVSSIVLQADKWSILNDITND